MITIFRRDSGTSLSFRKSVNWLSKHQLDFEIRKFSSLTKEELLQLLQLSEGFSDLLVTRTEAGRQRFASFQDMKTSHLMAYCLAHPDVFRDSICFDGRHLLVGYDEEEIRQFLPSNVRKAYFDRKIARNQVRVKRKDWK